MKKTHKLTIIISLILILLLALAGYFFTNFYSIHGNFIVHMRVENYPIRSEIVDDQSKREIGLGGRSGLCASCGMLFLFEGESKYAFWMKGMKFPIDILWLDDEKVLYMVENVPYSEQNRTYAPDKPARMVLELPAGTCEREGIREGSKVTFDGKEL